MTERIHLAHGDRLLVEQDPSLPLVDVDVVLPLGSLSDPEDRDGLMRLYARMLRRGVAKRAGRPRLGAIRLDREIEGLGAAISIEVSTRAIRIHGSVIRRNLEPLVGLLSRMIESPTLAPAELPRARREAEAEILALRDDDRALAGRAFRRMLFEGHPYGRLATGTRASLGRIRRDDLLACQETLPRLPGRIFAFAGDVDTSLASRLVEGFGRTAPTRRTAVSEVPDIAPKAGLRVVLVDKPERTQTQVVLGTVGLKLGEPDFFPVVVANTAFGGTFTARLVHEVRSVRGWSYSAHSRVSTDGARDAWWCYSHPSVETALDCIALERDLIESFVTEGLTRAEVAFAKRFLTKSHAFERDTASKRLEPYIEAALYGLDDSFHVDYVANVEAVAAPSANAATRRRLGGPSGCGRDLVLSVLGPRAKLEKALEKLPGLIHYERVAYQDLAD